MTIDDHPFETTVFDVEPIVPYQLCGSSTTEHRRLEVSSRAPAPDHDLKAIVNERKREVAP